MVGAVVALVGMAGVCIGAGTHASATSRAWGAGMAVGLASAATLVLVVSSIPTTGMMTWLGLGAVVILAVGAWFLLLHVESRRDSAKLTKTI
jgi:hypothetical protein